MMTVRQIQILAVALLLCVAALIYGALHRGSPVKAAAAQTCQADLAKARSALGNRDKALAISQAEHDELMTCRDKLEKLQGEAR